MKSAVSKIVLLLLIVSVFFSGCTLVDFFSAETLLRPPKLTGENAALQAAFEASVGKEIGLYTPIAGEHRASYILFDANNDDEDEAIVFYSSNSNKTVVHMHLLTKKDNEWISVADVIGSGTDVYKVDFFNIDDSDELEIAVMWSAEDSKREKTLSVYKISSMKPGKDDILTSLATILIADYVNIDFDNDSVDELLYMYFSVSEDSYYSGAKLMDFDSEQKKLVPLSEITFDFQISSFTNILSEKRESGYSIYLDCALPDNNYTTELVYYDFEPAALTIPQFEGKSLSVLAHRDSYRNCRDFNADGKTDVPYKIPVAPIYVYGLPAEESVTIDFVRWSYVDNGEFVDIGNYLWNETDGYYMNVNDLYSDFYFSYDYQNRTVQVRLDDSYSDDNILFTIVCENKAEDNYAAEENSFENASDADNDKISIDVYVTELGTEYGFVQKDIKETIEIL